jgi:cysteine-rich repeat protein
MLRTISARQAVAMLLALLIPAGARDACALPDLVPEVFDVAVATGDVLAGDVAEGCAGGRFGRRLVQFSLRTHNVGPDHLVMGKPGCPNCTLNPGAPCTNPLFVCGTAHSHAHFTSFARTEILDSQDQVVAVGRKYGFCLLDHNCPTPQYSCSFQGITSGCNDLYAKGLPCQYVDITDVPLADGVYRLRVTLDPDDALAEADETNNVSEVPFSIGSTPRVCPAFESGDVPKAIPHSGSVASTLTVPNLGPVTSLRLRMKGLHTFLGDLEARLTSPSGTSRVLFSGQCASQDNFDAYLGDGAIDDFLCPATDPSVLRRPSESFDAFHGENAGGQWTLTIQDTVPNDAGSLLEWSLEVCSVCGNGILDDGEVCDDGNLDEGDCCSSDCLLRADDGSSCEDGNLCTTAETCSAGVCVPHEAFECDPCLVCDGRVGCVVPDLIYPCQDAPSGGSMLQLRRNEADPTRDTLRWRWKSQTPVEIDELGAPESLTDVNLCIYDGSELLLSSTIPAAAVCRNAMSCWKRGPLQIQFRDREARFDGLKSLRLREGMKGNLLVTGAGSGLGLFGLQPALPLTVRLGRSDGTPCWEATFELPSRNSATNFQSRNR